MLLTHPPRKNCKWSDIDTGSLAADAPAPDKMATGDIIALSMRKVSELIGRVGKPSYPLLVPDWGWDQGKAGTCTIEVKMAAGGGSVSKKPASLARGNRGIGWGMDPPRVRRSLV